MEKNGEDLESILPYLPLPLRSSSLFWPSAVVEALNEMSRGPDHSGVDSGEVLFLAISDIRNSLSLSSERLASSSAAGYALFFDDLLLRADSAKWFGEVVPALAALLLRLPLLLETHYQHADEFMDGSRLGIRTSLRLLESQQPGIVILSQELIGALLACSFFCLFPTTNRGAKHLPTINFDHLFMSLHDSYSQKLENKLKCIIHYFERICWNMPVGVVSFERKVLSLKYSGFQDFSPQPDFWNKSHVPLCQFQVYGSGLIEDQSSEALEVDFANKYLGGGVLYNGCVQEEIRFLINPELIAGMLFLPAMSDNEAIEIIGTERFSNYTGYASSFQFSGDYVDRKERDSMGRRRTRVVAIDALSNQGKRQYRPEALLREVNKAFCGFFDQSKCQRYQRVFHGVAICSGQFNHDSRCPDELQSDLEMHEASPTRLDGIHGHECMLSPEKSRNYMDYDDNIGVVTGNWGCGAFGGDPQLKSIIQWLAASQALRPFISYYTFNMKALQRLDQVTEWILSHKWTVGDLWSILVEYSSRKFTGGTSLDFFSWLLPSVSAQDTDISCKPDVARRL